MARCYVIKSIQTTRSLRRQARVGIAAATGMAVDLSESWIDEQIARELEMLSVEDLEADEDSKEAENWRRRFKMAKRDRPRYVGSHDMV